MVLILLYVHWGTEGNEWATLMQIVAHVFINTPSQFTKHAISSKKVHFFWRGARVSARFMLMFVVSPSML